MSKLLHNEVTVCSHMQTSKVRKPTLAHSADASTGITGDNEHWSLQLAHHSRVGPTPSKKGLVTGRTMILDADVSAG